MKFTCTQIALVKAINTVSKAVSVRTTIPILKGILLKAEDNRLTMSASDLDLSIETSIDIQCYEEGSLVVPAKLFGDILRKLPNSIVNMTEEAGKLNINCLGSDFSVVTMPAEEFPTISEIKSNDFIDINKEDFSNLIRKTIFAASIDEKKGILTGTLLNFEDNDLELVALDGFRMALSQKNISTGVNKKIIVPARILAEINKIIAEAEGSDTISLVLEDKKIEILTEDTRVVARLLEGDFIKYREIIPSSHKTSIILSRNDLLQSIERAALLTKDNKNNLIKMNITDGSLDISSRSEEGNVNEHINIDKKGDDLVIGFNSKYILDVLKVVSDDEIKMEFGSSVNPALIVPVEGKEYTFLVLPVRI